MTQNMPEPQAAKLRAVRTARGGRPAYSDFTRPPLNAMHVQLQSITKFTQPIAMPSQAYFYDYRYWQSIIFGKKVSPSCHGFIWVTYET